ncbi:AbrB family transcriptional regulator [Staphylococcus massiliensis]|uniref:AbrB family transcriptional regulator n=1 Tax=Staphylococcus massiliensis TaxID=555791 RepID=UPI001EDF3E2B|nr:AbrB family transcriptional regulator [Staphylococcus massiliensis]MCG3400902.1 AbrB family transcriptional regulator [Staphylococcus massiliensis]
MKRSDLNKVIILLLSVVCGFILQALHIILPWMFGPIIASLICTKLFKMQIKWPTWLSNLGLIALGIQIGTSFTKTVIGDIKDDWISIILVSILLLMLALIISIPFRKIAGINRETAILSVIPGALSQMLVMAEENKKANMLIVSLTQTSRIIFVVMLVPLLSFLFQEKDAKNQSSFDTSYLTETLNIWHVLILVAGIVVVYYIMKAIKFPTKILLAPIVVLIVWNLSMEITFTLDPWLIAIAQIIYMIRIGLQISNLLNDLKGRIAIAIAFQNIMLILTALLMVIVLHFFNHQSINELFLGAAPGGMSQIILVALEVGADVAMISSYHIFRIFFILFIIAPLVGYYLKYMNQKKQE